MVGIVVWCVIGATTPALLSSSMPTAASTALALALLAPGAQTVSS